MGGCDDGLMRSYSISHILGETMRELYMYLGIIGGEKREGCSMVTLLFYCDSKVLLYMCVYIMYELIFSWEYLDF